MNHTLKSYTLLCYLSHSTLRLANYRRYCIDPGTTPHKFNSDMPVRWNSTYMMLKAVTRDGVSFSGFINAYYGVDPLIGTDT